MEHFEEYGINQLRGSKYETCSELEVVKNVDEKRPLHKENRKTDWDWKVYE